MTSPRAAHIIPPLALLASLIAVYAVVHGTLGSGGSSHSGATSTATSSKNGRSASKPARQGPARSYVVKPGDTLSNIAAKAGVGIEAIQRLNPDVAATSLRPGQKLKVPPARPR